MFNFSFSQSLVILSLFLGLLGTYAYTRDTIQGRTKPNRISFALWSIASYTGAFAAVASGADIWPTIIIFYSGTAPLVVFLASFVNPQSYWKLNWFDYACALFCMLALIFWQFAGQPILAILFCALADAFATLPTLIKTWRYPETETRLSYIAGFLSAVLVLPSIEIWNIQNSAFQIYLVVANTLLVLSVYRKKFQFKFFLSL